MLVVTGAEQVGGGPGVAFVRVHGHSDVPSAVPALLVAERGRDGILVRVEATGTPRALDAGAFALDYALPLHLAITAEDWWLEPPLAQHALPKRPSGPTTATHTTDLEALHARVADIAADLAALRARLDGHPAGAPPQVTPLTAIPVPRPRLGRLKTALPVALVAAGTLAVADAVATVVWQEPISGLYALREQHALDGDLEALDRRLARQQPAPTPATADAATLEDPGAGMRALAQTLTQTTDPGEPIGRLTIPSIGARQIVVQGTGTGSLRRGPGHYGETPLPGEGGTVAIAGHRTTYGAPFRRVDELRRGDAIDLRMPYGTFRYRVESTRIVKPQDVSALRDVGRERLALTACHPLYSAAKRIVVLARLERAQPRGAAAATPSRGGDGAAARPRA